MRPLTDLLSTKAKDKPFDETEAQIASFDGIKSSLADVTLLHHPTHQAAVCLMVDASDLAVGGVSQQWINGSWHPLSIYSKRLQKAESKYSTFGRELLAVYLSVRYFRHMLEGRVFTVYTDHKPITFALASKSDRYSPRGIRHLDYISQYITDIRHISGRDNVVAAMYSV